MSYLDFPRLNFSGNFMTDPSTINNDPTHYNDATFSPQDQQRGQGASDGWWNPRGMAYWQFQNCSVKSVAYKDGSIITDASADPIVGLPINGADEKVAGKLVDLDPQQQMVSEVWGFKINIGDMVSQIFKSHFRESPFADIYVRYPQGQPDSFFSAVYQSVLVGIEWGEQAEDSKFIQELKEANGGSLPDKLSVKFTVDGYDDDFNSPTFTLGRVSGAIGLYRESEPEYFVNARYLRPQGDRSIYNYAPCKVSEDKQWLFLDLANSLPTTSPGGSLLDAGVLSLAALTGKKQYKTIATIEYRSTDWYMNEAGIQAIPLNRSTYNLIKDKPLAIIKAGTSEPLLQENEFGAFIRADQFVFRLDTGESYKKGALITSKEVKLYATLFGEPAPNQEVQLLHDSSLMEGFVQQPGTNPGPPVGTPTSALDFMVNGKEVKTIKTDKNGVAKFTLQANDPGNPRGYIDGQVYGVAYRWKLPGIDSKQEYNQKYQPNPTNVLSVLVFDAYPVVKEPTWVDNVQPIFQQFANLYPVMKQIVDLGSFPSVISRLHAMKIVFDLPVTDPNYMPVTRDLSGAKKEMINRWLYNPIYSKPTKIKTVEELRAALQTAVELEHATIPPYLCAYYSIMPGKNQEVAEIIRSVVMEEMLHMSLACNLLNAVGGSPQINKPRFVPNYPGPLPGGVSPDLIVHLRKCSKEQIRDVFMAIEQPDELGNPPEHFGHTIGAFYDQILEGIESLGNRIFTGDESKQLTDWPYTGDLIKVTDVDSAKAAIEEIKEQGEGASPFNPEDGYDELAHYYKFAEIVNGRQIELSPDGFSYTGPIIEFDPDGVYPMMDDPDIKKFPPQTQAWHYAKEFNNAYAKLLNSLHTVFNGKPHELYKAIGLMFSLSVQATRLMDTKVFPGDTTTAGPTFQLE